MAHELNYNKVKHAYSFAARKPAWHGLGVTVEEAMTSQEAMRLACLDYDVELCENLALVKEIKAEESNLTSLYIRSDDRLQGTKHYSGTMIRGYKSIIRTDNFDFLGLARNRYKPVQNRDAFAFFDNVVKEKLAIFETAGALNYGETVFITAKLPGNINIYNDDIIDKYLLFMNTHDALTSINILFTPVRVVCNNTLTAAMANASNRITIRHTGNMENKLEIAANILGLANRNFEQLTGIYKEMYNKKIDSTTITNTILSLFLSKAEYILVNNNNNQYRSVEAISSQKKNSLDLLFEYLETGVGQQDIRGTVYSILNAVTGYFQNVRKYRSNEDKFNSLYKGDIKSDVFNLTQKTFDACVKLLKE